MGCDSNPNGSDFNIVTVVLQYGVIATLVIIMTDWSHFEYWLTKSHAI